MCPPAPSAQNRTAVWLFTMNAPADGAAVDIPTTSGSEIRIPRRAAGGFFCPAGGLFSPLGRGGNVCAPQRGGFCSSWKRGERLRPTFLFLSREKKKRAAPGTKKKSAWSGFREESCSFFVCVYVLTAGVLALCGLVLPLAPLPLTGALFLLLCI